MFGYLRLILSLFVLISHLGITFYGLNPGVIAVVIFYILAGYVVSHLYAHIIPNQKGKILLFYKNRIKRIFPLYLYTLFLTLIFILITSFGTPEFTPLKLLNNLLIIPLNFYMLMDNTILTNPAWWLIPPAWSLGTELQAYILLPFALLYPKIRQTLMLLSFAIYILANYSIIHPDYFGYRLIVGVFFIFLIGVDIEKNSHNQNYSYFSPYNIVWLSTIILISLSLYFEQESRTYTKETAIGISMGVPLVYLMAKSHIKLPLNSLFGALSYAIFLNHFLAIWITKYLLQKYTFIHDTTTIVVLTLTISIVGIYLEKSFCNKKHQYNHEKSVEKM